MSLVSKQHTQRIFNQLKKHYPHAKIILNYESPWELLVAVILSAQCTDVQVNKVTAELFPKYQKLSFDYAQDKNKKYKVKIKKITPEIQEIINFAEVDIHELENDIRSTGFYRNKANNIKASAQAILEKFNGRIPKTMKEMLTLPGVGRKTANVVLGNAYGVIEGIAVDTHVQKQSQLLGLTTNKTPDKIEQDLMRLYDKKDWLKLTYMLIDHGRAMGRSRKPVCKRCGASTCSLLKTY